MQDLASLVNNNYHYQKERMPQENNIVKKERVLAGENTEKYFASYNDYRPMLAKGKAFCRGRVA